MPNPNRRLDRGGLCLFGVSQKTFQQGLWTNLGAPRQQHIRGGLVLRWRGSEVRACSMKRFEGGLHV